MGYMKAHRIEICVLDFEDYGADDYIDAILRHFNARIVKHSTVDAGEWSDDHPLNQKGTNVSAYLDSIPVVPVKDCRQKEA